jgi:hypothetical protein
MPRTVTPETEREVRPEMSVLGWLIAAGSLLLLLPVLPFLAMLRLYDALRGRGADDERRPADNWSTAGDGVDPSQAP